MLRISTRSASVPAESSSCLRLGSHPHVLRIRSARKTKELVFHLSINKMSGMEEVHLFVSGIAHFITTVDLQNELTMAH